MLGETVAFGSTTTRELVLTEVSSVFQGGADLIQQAQF